MPEMQTETPVELDTELDADLTELFVEFHEKELPLAPTLKDSAWRSPGEVLASAPREPLVSNVGAFMQGKSVAQDAYERAYAYYDVAYQDCLLVSPQRLVWREQAALEMALGSFEAGAFTGLFDSLIRALAAKRARIALGGDRLPV